jgi:hypothetical protein
MERLGPRLLAGPLVLVESLALDLGRDQFHVDAREVVGEKLAAARLATPRSKPDGSCGSPGWVAAVDLGRAVNPDGVVGRIEGDRIQATSWTLEEEWRPGTLGWEDYPIFRFSDAPAVAVRLVKSEHPSVGAGECAMGPTEMAS